MTRLYRRGADEGGPPRLDDRWDELYRATRSDLYRVAAYLLGPVEGEETVQETFERAMREPEFFSRIREPYAWLRRVAVRIAVSRLRRRMLWERIRLRISPDASHLPDPELRDALQRLPPTQRGAVMLRYYFGADYAEIAKALGISQNSVGTTLSRARASLREALRS